MNQLLLDIFQHFSQEMYDIILDMNIHLSKMYQKTKQALSCSTTKSLCNVLLQFFPNGILKLHQNFINTTIELVIHSSTLVPYLFFQYLTDTSLDIFTVSSHFAHVPRKRNFCIHK